jgi:hypothetical protein
MGLKMTFKEKLTATTGITFAFLFFNAMPGLAFTFMNPRSLNENERLANESIFKLQTPWALSGTLNGANSFTTTFDFPFPSGTRDVTGSRNFISSTPTSYEQQFAGEYEDAPPLKGWGPGQFNLFRDSQGKIEQEWGQVPGWRTITGAMEQFTQTWELTKTRLTPGELNCPTMFNGKEVTGCPVVETWWGGALDIKAGASLAGSIANSVPGTELTSLTLQLDRDLDYKIDSKTDRIASINSGVYELKLTDAGFGLDDINIKFKAIINGKEQELQVSGDTVWRQTGPDIETANPSYQLKVGTNKYLTQGVRSLYTEKLVDFPTMRLGILLNNGTGATASSFLGAFNPDSDRQAVIQIETVPEPPTIVGSATALGFGILLKRKSSKKKNKS